jgi:hypothetical protein
MLTRLVADGTREFDLELTIPAKHLAVVIDALADGIARQKVTDPQACGCNQVIRRSSEGSGQNIPL